MKAIITLSLLLASTAAFSSPIENVFLHKETVEDSYENCLYAGFQKQMVQRTGYALFSTLTVGPDLRFIEIDGELEIDFTRARYLLSGKEMPSNTLVRYYLDFQTADNSEWDIEYETPDEFYIIGMRSELMSSIAVVSKETGENTEKELFRFDVEECRGVLTE